MHSEQLLDAKNHARSWEHKDKRTWSCPGGSESMEMKACKHGQYRKIASFTGHEYNKDIKVTSHVRKMGPGSWQWV
jgi:hypothetical protein